MHDPFLSLRPELEVERVMPSDTGWLFHCASPDGKTVLEVEKHAERAFTHAGDYGVSYRDSEPQRGVRAARHFAAWLGRSVRPLASLVHEHEIFLEEKNTPERVGDLPGAFGQLLPALRERAALLRAKGGGLVGLPLCLGGGPAVAPVTAAPGVCASCRDVERCARPNDARVVGDEWGDLRPRATGSDRAEIHKLLGELGVPSEHYVRQLSLLSDYAERCGGASWELSYKFAPDWSFEGPRLTVYQHRANPELALAALGKLTSDQAGFHSTTQHLRDKLAGLPCQIGYAYSPRGVGTKLYVAVQHLPPAEQMRRATQLLAPFAPSEHLEALQKMSLFCVGFAWRPGQALRLRVYEITHGQNAQIPDADPDAGVAWDYADGAWRRTSRFCHFEAGHPMWSDIEALLEIPRDAAECFRAALARPRSRVYLSFVAFGDSGRSFYAKVGAAPRARPWA